MHASLRTFRQWTVTCKKRKIKLTIWSSRWLESATIDIIKPSRVQRTRQCWHYHDNPLMSIVVNQKLDWIWSTSF